MKDKVLKTAFQNKQYGKCVEIISAYIIENIVTEIQNINRNFKYTNIFDLINASELYLKGYKKTVVKDIYMIQTGSLDDLIKISLLIGIYKELKKK